MITGNIKKSQNIYFLQEKNKMWDKSIYKSLPQNLKNI